MTTKLFYFTGPCKWAKVHKPDEYNGETKFKIDLYLSKKGLSDLSDAGSKVKIKEDDDGKFVTFSRKTELTINGETTPLAPPMVIGPDKEPFLEDIGNGSIVTVKAAIYDTKMGKGTRLEAVRVDEWVEFVPQAQGEF